jgi:hypothetical protein
MDRPAKPLPYESANSNRLEQETILEGTNSDEMPPSSITQPEIPSQDFTADDLEWIKWLATTLKPSVRIPPQQNEENGPTSILSISSQPDLR